MREYQQGSKAAFRELVARHQRGLYNFALRFVRDGAAAEDVTQDAFVRIAKNFQEYSHQARFTTWAYTITRNLCIDQLRKRSHRNHTSIDEPGHAEAPDASPRAHPERAAQAELTGRRIEEAVQALPVEQREVFLLREVAGVPFKEIAESLGIPENTVKSRMRYALERLQKDLQELAELAGEESR